MKKLIAAMTIALASINASATVTEGFTELYEVKSFAINPASEVIFHKQNIDRGVITINRQAREMKLIIQPRFNCPDGRICAMVMPAPQIITLPIIHVGSPFCGGRIVTAQINDLANGGSMITMQVFDPNGNICFNDKKIQPLQVSFSERAPQAEKEIVSHFTAAPLR